MIGWAIPWRLGSAPPRGGSKLQTAFVVENGDVKALIVVICTYAESHATAETLEWIEQEALGFDGDFIIFCNHHAGIYRNVRDMLMQNDIKTPALFLHGHNHGPDTLTRDAWGYERDALDFPSYLLTAFRGKGLGAKFELHREGHYETFRLDARRGELSEPAMHVQTRVR